MRPVKDFMLKKTSIISNHSINIWHENNWNYYEEIEDKN